MKHSEMTMLRYKWTPVAVSENSGASFKAAANTILALLDHIQFCEDEIDRIQAKVTAEVSDADS